MKDLKYSAIVVNAAETWRLNRKVRRDGQYKIEFKWFLYKSVRFGREDSPDSSVRSIFQFVAGFPSLWFGLPRSNDHFLVFRWYSLPLIWYLFLLYQVEVEEPLPAHFNLWPLIYFLRGARRETLCQMNVIGVIDWLNDRLSTSDRFEVLLKILFSFFLLLLLLLPSSEFRCVFHGYNYKAFRFDFSLPLLVRTEPNGQTKIWHRNG